MNNSHDEIFNSPDRLNYLFMSFIEYALDHNLFNREDFIDFCNIKDIVAYQKLLQRNEDEMRSANHEMHPYGEQATVTLLTMANIKPEERILDAGCGHGGVCRVIADRFCNPVVGIDADCLKVLDAIFNTKLQQKKQITYYIDDAYHTRFQNNSFDIILRQHAVYGQNEKIFIKECYRLLSCGGRIAFQGVLTNMKNHLFKNENKMEHYTLIEYIELLKQNGFNVLAYETEESTHELRDSYQHSNPSLYALVESGVIIGIKIVAEKTLNTCEG